MGRKRLRLIIQIPPACGALRSSPSCPFATAAGPRTHPLPTCAVATRATKDANAISPYQQSLPCHVFIIIHVHRSCQNPTTVSTTQKQQRPSTPIARNRLAVLTRLPNSG